MTRGRDESGFALLLVFAMASIIAITMYMSLPRIAFESERDKEQLLIDRGEQYSRAIQLYVRKTKRFPAKIEDLENTNGIRFLRKQYIDPMTGKGEWRIIHAGPGGVLIDSLVQKQTKKEAAVVDNFITELPATGGALPGDTNTNPALRRRPSEQGGAPGGLPNSGPIPPDPGIAQNPTPIPANPNVTPTQQQAGYASGISVLPSFGGGPTAPPSVAPPQIPPQSQRFNQSPLPGQIPVAIQQQINNPNGQAPPGTVPTNAGMLIQNLLTTPRPGGLPGGAQQQQQGQIVGGGIAGIASNYKGTGIKLYHDQDEVPKWEFVYDVAKDVSMNPAAGIPQAAAPPGTPIGGAQPQPIVGPQQQQQQIQGSPASPFGAPPK